MAQDQSSETSFSVCASSRTVQLASLFARDSFTSEFRASFSAGADESDFSLPGPMVSSSIGSCLVPSPDSSEDEGGERERCINLMMLDPVEDEQGWADGFRLKFCQLFDLGEREYVP
jgi:hypothetical protein